MEHIVLISTCDMKGGRSDVLQRMIASVERTAPAMEGRLTLFLLLQRFPKKSRAKFAVPAFVKVQASDGLTSLSGARNLLLNAAFREDLPWENTVIAFPDDDGFYPPSTLETVVKAFEQDRELDFWFCRYAAAPVGAGEPGLPEVRVPSLKDVVRRASSNTIFLRGSLARRIGHFDEELGVGTHNGSGEDTDVAVQAFILARHALYLDAASVGHRDPNPALRARYFRGALVVLARYAGMASGMRREFIRKLAIGVYLVLKRELAFGDYLAAAAAAMANLAQGKTAMAQRKPVSAGSSG